jgi:hypothetical protein
MIYRIMVFGEGLSGVSRNVPSQSKKICMGQLYNEVVRFSSIGDDEFRKQR